MTSDFTDADLTQRLQGLDTIRRQLEPDLSRTARAALTHNDLERVLLVRQLAHSSLRAFAETGPAPADLRRLELLLDALDVHLRDQIRPHEAEYERFNVSVRNQTRAETARA